MRRRRSSLKRLGKSCATRWMTAVAAECSWGHQERRSCSTVCRLDQPRAKEVCAASYFLGNREHPFCSHTYAAAIRAICARLPQRKREAFFSRRTIENRAGGGHQHQGE